MEKAKNRIKDNEQKKTPTATTSDMESIKYSKEGKDIEPKSFGAHGTAQDE